MSVDGTVPGMLGGNLSLAGSGPRAAAFRKPSKTFLHLTTTVDSLAFSPDSQARPGSIVANSQLHSGP